MGEIKPSRLFSQEVSNMNKHYHVFLNEVFKYLPTVQDPYDISPLISVFKNSDFEDIFSQNISGKELTSSIFESLDTIVPYIFQYKHDNSRFSLLQDNSIQISAQLLKAVIQELNNISSDSKIALETVSALFAITAYFQEDEYHVWEKLNSEVQVNQHLLNLIAANLKRYEISLDLTNSSISIHEQELLLQYKKGLTEKSFSKIYSLIDALGWQMDARENYLISELVRFLFHFNSKSLINILNQKTDTITIYYLLKSLTTRQKSTVCLKTNNVLVQFEYFHQTISRHSRNIDFLPDKIELLSQCIVNFVDMFEDTWSYFLSYFNQFTCRYPHLQIPLGKALSQMSNDQIYKYVYSLEISQYSNDQEYLNNCLNSFIKSALDEKRHFLFHEIFQRWNNFMSKGLKPIKPDINALLGIFTTVFRDAVVYYLKYYFAENAMVQEITYIAARLTAINTEWFDPPDSQQSVFTVLLSKLYVYSLAWKNSNYALKGTDLECSLRKLLNNRYLFHVLGLSSATLEHINVIKCNFSL